MAEYLQVRKNGRIKLPASILRKANLKEGDLLEAVVEQDGSIRLLPKSSIEKLIQKQQLMEIDWSRQQKRKKTGQE